MLLALNEVLFIGLLFFVIAILYSSVGFGGGSSYLAILSLFLGSFLEIRSIALLCNLVVVSGSCYLYFKNGHLLFKKFLPFVISSIPMAFIGAQLKLEQTLFFGILGAVLVLSALSLAFQTLNKKKKVGRIYEGKRAFPSYMSILLGAVIGLLSGLVGIGGGIFLAPVLHYFKWDITVRIAALASFFILINSFSGIIGLLSNDSLEIPGPELLLLLLAVFLGGQIGIRLGLTKISSSGIRLLTALMVFSVGIRVVLVEAFHIKL